MYKCTIATDVKENAKSSSHFHLISCIYMIFINMEKRESQFFLVIMVLRKWVQLEAESLHSSLMSSLVREQPTPPRSITPMPLPPPPTLVEKKHSTPKVKKTQLDSAMAAMMEQFQQSISCHVSPMKTPVKNTP